MKLFDMFNRGTTSVIIIRRMLHFLREKRKGIISIITAIVFLFVFNVFPSLHAITVEEAAGKKGREGERLEYRELKNKAQERRNRQGAPQEKDPRLACMLSLIVPGGGHVYLHKDLKGVSFCLLSGIGYGVSGYFLYLGLLGSGSKNEKKSNIIISGLLFAVAAVIHIVGVVEAYNDAIEINEEDYYFGNNKSESPYIASIEFEQ